jgi:hypothetical protein
MVARFEWDKVDRRLSSANHDEIRRRLLVV